MPTSSWSQWSARVASVGADDEQLALHLQHEVVHLTLEVGARETQRTARLIDGAVRGGPQVMLVDPTAVEQPCRAVVALLRVHLHRVLVPVIEPSACMSLHRVASLPTLPAGLGGQRTGSAPATHRQRTGSALAAHERRMGSGSCCERSGSVPIRERSGARSRTDRSPTAARR